MRTAQALSPYRLALGKKVPNPLLPCHDGRRPSSLRSALHVDRSHASSPSLLSQDVTECLGNVPIVRLNRFGALTSTRNCYLKLESCNPGGSIKEKNALCLVQSAEQDGWLKPGGTIVESSSGNLGIGLAIVGAVRGYRVVIVIDQKTTPPFRRMLQAHGAELVEVPASAADASGSMQRARMQKAKELAAEIPGAWYPCQHLNPLNPEAHFKFTAREIDRAFKGNLDGLVVGVSTGGQLTGLARYLRPRYPHLKIVAADVSGSSILGEPAHAYKMTGVGLAFRPPHLNYEAIHQGYNVPESLAYSVCHTLAKQEGMLLGASTGVVVAAGLRLASELPKGSRILMINADRGDRYLETVYNQEWLTANGFDLFSASELESQILNLQALYPD